MSTIDPSCSILELIKIKFDEIYNIMAEREKKMSTQMEKLVSDYDSLRKAVGSVVITQSSTNADHEEKLGRNEDLEKQKLVEMEEEEEEEIHRLRLQFLQVEEKLRARERKCQKLQRQNEELKMKKKMVKKEGMVKSVEQSTGTMPQAATPVQMPQDCEFEDSQTKDELESDNSAEVNSVHHVANADGEGQEPNFKGKAQASSSAAGIVIELSDSDDELDPVDTTHLPNTLSGKGSKRKITECEDHSPVNPTEKRERSTFPQPSSCCSSAQSSRGLHYADWDEESCSDTYMNHIVAVLQKQKDAEEND